jgi:hypothetical protein
MTIEFSVSIGTESVIVTVVVLFVSFLYSCLSCVSKEKRNVLDNLEDASSDSSLEERKKEREHLLIYFITDNHGEYHPAILDGSEFEDDRVLPIDNSSLKKTVDLSLVNDRRASLIGTNAWLCLGILTQPTPASWLKPNRTTYLAASYVKYIEATGAQVVPIR